MRTDLLLALSWVKIDVVLSSPLVRARQTADIVAGAYKRPPKIVEAKELAPDHGEIKSMRTAPYALGRGVGRALLNHIMAEARTRGYSRLSLETGSTEPFAAALRLYEREGFSRCPPFGEYSDTQFTRFFTRQL